MKRIFNKTGKDTIGQGISRFITSRLSFKEGNGDIEKILTNRKAISNLAAFLHYKGIMDDDELMKFLCLEESTKYEIREVE